MSTAEIIAELPKLSPQERRLILDHLIALDNDTEDDILEFHRHRADEAFQILDRMEAEDAENSAR